MSSFAFSSIYFQISFYIKTICVFIFEVGFLNSVYSQIKKDNLIMRVTDNLHKVIAIDNVITDMLKSTIYYLFSICPMYSLFPFLLFLHSFGLFFMATFDRPWWFISCFSFLWLLQGLRYALSQATCKYRNSTGTLEQNAFISSHPWYYCQTFHFTYVNHTMPYQFCLKESIIP